MLNRARVRAPKGGLHTFALPRAPHTNTIRFFVEMKVTGSIRPSQQADEIPVRIPLPFKDQRSANKLREQLSDLSQKINTEVHPVFTNHKIKDEFKSKEPKPPIVNQQNFVYFFKCDLCDADYVGFTSRNLHQRVEVEHKRLVIGNHLREQHGNEPCEIAKNFRVLRKSSNKFDILIFEMFFIRDLKPKLNRVIPSAQSCLLNTSNIFHSLHLLFALHFRILLFLLFVCKYLAF